MGKTHPAEAGPRGAASPTHALYYDTLKKKRLKTTRAQTTVRAARWTAMMWRTSPPPRKRGCTPPRYQVAGSAAGDVRVRVWRVWRLSLLQLSSNGFMTPHAFNIQVLLCVFVPFKPSTSSNSTC